VHLDVGRHLAVLELELALRPEEEVVDRLLGLALQAAAHGLLAEDAVAHQDGPQQPPLGLLP
jgi:hypothetical protein